MIKIDSHSFHEYTMLVNGNGGENQLVVSASCGQGGKAKVVVTRMSVDMGGEVKSYVVPNNELQSRIRIELDTWCNSGLPPKDTREQNDKMRAISKIMTEVRIKWLRM